MAMLSSAFEKAMTSVNTWNGATSLSTPDISGKTDGRLSLFFKTARGLSDGKLIEYLQKSSKEDLLDTFILSFQTHHRIRTIQNLLRPHTNIDILGRIYYNQHLLI